MYKAFSHDVTAAILVFQNNETAAMLVFQTNPVGVELFSNVKTFFCSNVLGHTLKFKVKQNKNGKFLSNYKASPIDLKRKFPSVDKPLQK